MKKNTSVSIDTELIDKVRSMGFSVSRFTERAIETLVSDGFDDFTLGLKIRLYKDALGEIASEQDACNKRHVELEQQHKDLTVALKDAMEQLEVAQSIGKLTKLTQRLNRIIIMNNYNADIVVDKAHDIIVDMMGLNPEFNLEQHILSLRRMLND